MLPPRTEPIDARDSESREQIRIGSASLKRRLTDREATSNSMDFVSSSQLLACVTRLHGRSRDAPFEDEPHRAEFLWNTKKPRIRLDHELLESRLQLSRVRSAFEARIELKTRLLRNGIFRRPALKNPDAYREPPPVVGERFEFRHEE